MRLYKFAETFAEMQIFRSNRAMKNKILIVLVSALVAVGLHAYLAMHYYPLKFASSTVQSMCNVGEKMNCDAVSASSYSAFLGIPMAVWGLAANLILFLMVLFYWWRLSDNSARLGRWSLVLSAFILLASVVMGTISLTLMTTYCLFCIILYVLSILTFEFLRRSQDGPVLKNLKDDLVAIATESRSIAIFLITIPIIAYFVHSSFVSQYGGDQIERAINSAVYDWQSGKQVQFNANPMLISGPEQSKMVLTEFADFRCGHCQLAAPSIRAFKKSHPDVHVQFFVFPLDSECNPDMPHSAGGVTCRLSKAVYCAEKQNMGWYMHDAIFTSFQNFDGTVNSVGVDEKLKPLAMQVGLDWNPLVLCMEEVATHDAVVAQAKAAVQAGVQGTPTIFVNGRKLPYGQMIPVLEKVYQLLKSQ